MSSNVPPSTHPSVAQEFDLLGLLSNTNKAAEPEIIEASMNDLKS